MNVRRRARALLAASVMLGAAAVPMVANPVPAEAATVTYYPPADGVLHLAGHGYGHGHGMSQWGAYGGAESGKTYKQILAWYYANPAFGTASGTIKVQLTADGRGSDGSYDARVKPAAGLKAVDSAGHSLTLPTTAADGTAIDTYRAVIASDGTDRVQVHAGGHWSSVAPTGGSITSWTGWVRMSATGGVLTLIRPDGSTELYRDVIELDPTSGTAAITVNRLSLEHYLAGVVSSEMPCGWTPTVGGSKRLDALESQAIAARSYAAWRRQHPRSAQVDIVDSTADQAYHGYSAEQSALTACPWTNPDGSKTSAEAAAVSATAGQVMVDGSGAPIFAQYSASNGGYEVAGSQSYLPSRPDLWDGVPTESWNSHSWSDSVTAGQIQAAYPSIGKLVSVAVGAREGLSGTNQNGTTTSEQWGGRITSLTLTGTAGSVTTTGASFAGALGLMSSWFTVVVSRPTAPATVTASAGDTTATVRWSAPSSDGGGGIRSYTITASPAIPTVTVSGTARSATITGLTNDVGYTFSVHASNTAGSGPATAAAAVTPAAHVLFHALAPRRVLDTRNAGGALGPGAVRSVTVLGVGGVPSSGVIDVALNVVSIDPTAASSVAIYPHGGARPADAQLSFPAAQRVNALVVTKVGSGGKVDLRNASGSTQLFVDVQGYFTPAAAAGDVLTTVNPTKLFDSRSGSPVAARSVRTLPVAGHAGVPSGATAALVQLTAAHPAQRDYVTAWGSGAPKPSAYELYAPQGRYTDAVAVVPLTSAGGLQVSPLYTTHLVVSLLGWYAPGSTTPPVTSLLTPTLRLAKLTVGKSGSVTVASRVPSGAVAVWVAVAGAGPLGAPVSVYPAGGGAPSTATLHLAGVTVSTTTLVRLGSGGRITIHNGSSAPVQVDVNVIAWSAG
jgi:SpoIID/LytB domain protein